jgi:hypothetical protein
MKKLFNVIIALSFITIISSCGAAKKAEREAAKRLEQLEKAKQQYEQKNKGDLGK